MMKNLSFPVKELTLSAMAWMSSNQFVNAQHTPYHPFKGKIGKTVKETQESWPENKKSGKRSSKCSLDPT